MNKTSFLNKFQREGFSVYNKIYEFEAMVQGRQTKMVMTSVSGHLLQLEFLPAYRNWKTVNPISLFDAPVRKTCNEDFQKIKKTLEREIRGCQGLIIWTDCDREGENIGFEIVEVCQAVKPNIQIHRAKFSEITTAGVTRALNNLIQLDGNMNNAVNIRTELDLRTGAALTRFQTLRLQRVFPTKIENLISYGSCQIPTLGFVCERYKEIEAFVSEAFWKLKVTHTLNDLTVEFNWARNRLFDKEAVEDYLMICLADPTATVEKAVTKPKSKWRPQPLDTVEMEKLASRKLKLAAKDAMTIAEKLYTQGYISYPRTETNMFSKEIDLKKLVELQEPHPQWGQFASRVIESGPNPRNGSKTDQAHPPIHPTKIATNLQGNEARLYELITRHFLACVSKDALGSETVVNIDIGGEKFTATGLVILERNYLDVYIYEKWNAKEIHLYREGQQFQPDEISMQEGATTAPPLLTEADLIALMDKHGIGTDATHAEHINTIKERGYIGTVDKGFLVPGSIGMGLYEGYVAMDLALAKPNLRAEFEDDLKKICAGTKDFRQILQEQIVKYKEAYQIMEQRVLSLDEKMGARISETPRANPNNNDDVVSHFPEVYKCPKCKIANMALKRSNNGNFPFLTCLNFPECKNTVWFSKDIVKDVTLSDKKCRRCGDEVFEFKIMFINMYYKLLFDTPTGWYETCLRCDTKLRTALGINLDQIKSVGRIIETSTTPVVRAPPTQPITNSLSLQNYSSNSSTSLRGNGRNNQGPKKSSSNSNNQGPKKSSSSSKKNSKPPNTRAISTYLNQQPQSNSGDSSSTAIVLDDSNDLFSGEDFDMIAAVEAVDPANTISNEESLENAAVVANTLSGLENVDLNAMFDEDFEVMAQQSNNGRPQSNYEDLFDDDDVFDCIDTSGGRSQNTGNVSQRPTPRASDDSENIVWGTRGRSNFTSINDQREPNIPCDSGDLVWGIKGRTNTTQRSDLPSTSNQRVPNIPCHSEDVSWGTKGRSNSNQNNYGRSQNIPSDSADIPWGTKGRSQSNNFPTPNNQRVPNDSGDVPWGTKGRANTTSFPSSNNERAPNITCGSGDVPWGTKGRSNATSRNDQEPSDSGDVPWGTKGRANTTSFPSRNNERAPNITCDSGDVPWGTKGRSNATSRNDQEPTDSENIAWGTGSKRHFPAPSTSQQPSSSEDYSWGSSSNQRIDSDKENDQAIREWAAERNKIRKQDAFNRRSGNFASTSNYDRNKESSSKEFGNQAINCPKCNASLNRLTVRKEGPNTGRQFYSCKNSCNFFQWADDVSTNSSVASSSGANATSTSVPKQRAPKKCGLCRQVGHTKVKCPNKHQFGN